MDFTPRRQDICARRNALLGLLAVLVTGVIPASAEARPKRKPRAASGGGGSRSGGGSPRFSSCKEARAAGYTRMRRGEPGYSSNLDRDGDGIACE
jgi:hypothetical protein